MNEKELLNLLEEIEGYCLQEAEYNCWECSTADVVLDIIKNHKEKEDETI